jgi:hypothetical protein
LCKLPVAKHINRRGMHPSGADPGGQAALQEPTLKGLRLWIFSRLRLKPPQPWLPFGMLLAGASEAGSETVVPKTGRGPVHMLNVVMHGV